MDKISISHPISFLRYQTKCVTKCVNYVFTYTVDSIINFKNFLESIAKAMADREKKRGR